ncbi:MAG TPA: ABC transporter substrate-binding protein [Geminicoccus sp.]|uniref:ABC transporter substrate-binding protein n=1 Tax=Geminicoccus sp. TaxID=2024832 RepID=UPI002C8E2950|nr:ABC transporter substrate-binding protein [Geminicoccus sp.]HWL67029.1 ABC transporter substrate-binding protein [Geminicoccus sp.]
MKKIATLSAVAALGLGVATEAHAEADALRVAKQYGLGYIQLMIMEEEGLVEKHLQKAGMGDVTVEWATFRSSDVMNDALISGNIDFASLGPTGIVTIWERTKGSYDVKVAAGLNALPWILTVRDPSIKSIADFDDDDRIAVPAVKVSGQAAALQMAAAKQWGDDQFERLDHLTVSLSHPDATAAMLGGPSEIVANFTSPPYGHRQLKNPNIHAILTSGDVLGGLFSFNVIATTAAFREDNPTLYNAFLGALQEATDRVNADMDWAADMYLKISNDPTPKEEILEIMQDKEARFTTEPLNLGAFSDFMARTGRIKEAPEDWRAEMLFPEAQ